MKITTENIEAFLLDYHTGQLNQLDQLAVENFLMEHPEWKMTLDDLCFLPDDATQFPAKDRLKKSANSDEAIKSTTDQKNKEELLFLHTEGLLNDAQKLELDTYRQANHIFDRTVELSKHVRLIPDYTIVFPSKAKLKRSQTKRSWVLWLSSAAAAVILIVSFVVNQALMTQKNVELAKESVVSFPSKIKRKINRERVEQKSSVSNLSLEDEEGGSLVFTNQKHPLKATDRLKQPLDSVLYPPKEMEANDQELELAVINSPDSIPSVKGNELTHIKQQKSGANSDHHTINHSDEYVTSIHSVNIKSNWQTASEKLASISKNKIVFNGTSNWNFYLKIGKFSISRKKNIAKSNLSMR